ncbi:M48 family metallopeptidase [Bacillus sp. OTU2372]|uniref:M48 family metallopeptidase n=1 Tax=Bacillus sp. OTU2372 TaxID=3043858 RepID=UPI00313F0583
MTNEQFESLVLKLEQQANENLTSYRTKVVMLALLGYGYLCIILAICVAVIGYSIYAIILEGFHYALIKILLLAGVLVLYLLRSLIFKMNPPSGRIVCRDEAAGLFEILDELKTKLKAPAIDTVILTEDMNAGIVQLPKFGFFGPNRNYLLLGVPLLLTLSSEQMKAVLGHEVAHLTTGDGKLDAWIYRLRQTWGTFMGTLEERQQFGTFLFRKFFYWYYPIFDAHAFVLSRMEEYRADRAAAEVASAKDHADALLQLEIADPYLNNAYFDELIKTHEDKDEMPRPYGDFRSKINMIPDETKKSYLDDALERKTNAVDTHPSLSDRLAAVGINPYIPKISNPSAFATFFNASDEILKEFDLEWREERKEDWEIALQEHRESLMRFDMLKSSEPESLEDSLELAILTEQFSSMKEAIPLYEAILERFPPNLDTAYAFLKVGEHYLIGNSNEKGKSYLETAMKLNWAYRLDGLSILCQYYERNGNKQKFEEYLRQLHDWEETLWASDEERDYFTAKDDYVPHDITEEVLNPIVAKIKEIPAIEEVYLVRRMLKVIPERKQYVFGIISRSEIDPDDFFNGWEILSASMVLLNKHHDIKKRLQKVPNSKIV